MLCSCGGETCTAAKPAGPRFCSHSFAMSRHFHSKRWTNTSPWDMCPLARYVCASAGRSTGGWPVIGGSAGELLQLVASASGPMQKQPIRATKRRIGCMMTDAPGAALRSLVARILLELRVGHELCGRDREHVQ